MQADRARLCIRAAEMRSKGQTYGKIAEMLGIPDADGGETMRRGRLRPRPRR